MLVKLSSARTSLIGTIDRGVMSTHNCKGRVIICGVKVQSLASFISKSNQQPGRSVGTNGLSKPVASRSGV